MRSAGRQGCGSLTRAWSLVVVVRIRGRSNRLAVLLPTYAYQTTVRYCIHCTCGLALLSLSPSTLELLLFTPVRQLTSTLPLSPHPSASLQQQLSRPSLASGPRPSFASFPPLDQHRSRAVQPTQIAGSTHYHHHVPRRSALDFATPLIPRR